MDATTTQAIALLIILVTFVINALVRLRSRPALRPISAFDALPRMTGESIEASRPLHVSLGSATIGDDSTILAMVGKEFIYYLAREVAIGDAPPIFTVGNTAALPMALSTLRRAYAYEERLEVYQPVSARWYPSDQKQLAFAAALMTMQADDEVSGNALVGRYGAELALILDASNRYDRPSVAVSDDITGQAIAYALAQEALIGEEIFSAPAYLSDDANEFRRVVATDVLRYILIVSIIGLAVFLALFGNGA